MEMACESDDEPLWEERILLIEAGSEDEAVEKAEARAKSNEHSYSADQDRSIEVKFDSIDRVYPIEGLLRDGAELFSRFLRNSEVSSLKTPFDE